MRANRLIDKKAGNDGIGFKSEVVRIATAAAAASKDGPFGTSGNAINEQESAALATLGEMLGLTPAS